MGTEKTRAAKIQWLSHYIRYFFEKKPHDSIVKSALCSEFMLSFGSTERTFNEILDMFAGQGMITINGDKILKGRKNIQEKLLI